SRDQVERRIRDSRHRQTRGQKDQSPYGTQSEDRRSHEDRCQNGGSFPCGESRQRFSSTAEKVGFCNRLIAQPSKAVSRWPALNRLAILIHSNSRSHRERLSHPDPCPATN